MMCLDHSRQGFELVLVQPPPRAQRIAGYEEIPVRKNQTRRRRRGMREDCKLFQTLAMTKRAARTCSLSPQLLPGVRNKMPQSCKTALRYLLLSMRLPGRAKCHLLFLASPL